MRLAYSATCRTAGLCRRWRRALVDRFFSQYTNLTSPSDLVVLMAHPVWTVDDAAFQSAASAMRQSLADKFPIQDAVDPFLFPFLSSSLVSNDRRMAIYSARFPPEIENLTTPPYEPDFKEFKAATKGSPLELVFGGDVLARIENSGAVNSGLASITAGFPVLVVLLILAFNGLVAVLAPLLLIIWTIILSFAVLRLVALGFHVSVYSTEVCAIFGAGLGMDYALFMHLRFMEGNAA